MLWSICNDNYFLVHMHTYTYTWKLIRNVSCASIKGFQKGECCCIFTRLVFPVSKTVCLSACLTNCQPLSLPLCRFDRSASLSICISAFLACLEVSENEVKLGEDVRWSRENSWCMTPSLRLGWRAVSAGPVHCLAFVCDISSELHAFTVKGWFTGLTAPCHHDHYTLGAHDQGGDQQDICTKVSDRRSHRYFSFICTFSMT